MRLLTKLYLNKFKLSYNKFMKKLITSLIISCFLCLPAISKDLSGNALECYGNNNLYEEIYTDHKCLNLYLEMFHTTIWLIQDTHNHKHIVLVHKSILIYLYQV